MFSCHYHEKNTAINESPLQLYHKKLYHYFSQTTDYAGFTTLLEKELAKHEIFSWSYTILDLPDKLAIKAHLGTIDQNAIDEYMESSLHEHDMTLQHVKHSDRPIFQSDIECHLKLSRVSGKNHAEQEKIIRINKKFGHNDICNIPVTKTFDNSRFLFCVNSKGGDCNKFRRHILKKIPWIKTLSIAVNEVGIELFPEHFLNPVKQFKSISLSRGLNLLATMAKYDLTVAEGARRLGITESTATKHLIRIRKLFNVKTNWAAYYIAIKDGYLQLT